MELICHDLGRMAYGPALDLQQRLVSQVQSAPEGPAHLLLVEHDPPAITTGRRPCPQQVLVSPEQLARMGIEFHATSRGGTVTYHGPGQLVAYPIVPLASMGWTVRAYVRGLEEAVIRTLAKFDLPAGRAAGMTGVWVGREKIAAIGVAVSRWVTWHGLALNVSTDLRGFNHIIPCGLAGRGVTSMSRCLGREVSVAQVKPVLVQCLRSVLAV